MATPNELDIPIHDDAEPDAEQQAETAAADTPEEQADALPEKTSAELQAEAERLRRQLKETNRKAASDRKRLEEIDREKQEKEESKLSDTQKIKKRLELAEERAREAEAKAAKYEADLFNVRMDREIVAIAKGRLASPDLAPKVVDRDRIEWDEETGKFTGIEKAIDRVLKEFPDLQVAQRGGGSPSAMRTKRPGSEAGAQERVASVVDTFMATGDYNKI